MYYIKTNQFLNKDEDGKVEIKNKAIIKPIPFKLGKQKFSICSSEINDITRFLKSSHPTKKIHFKLIYPDKSWLDFFSIEKAVVKYDEEIGIVKTIPRGISATSKKNTFEGGYGITNVIVGIDSKFYDWLIDSIIVNIKARNDFKELDLDRKWENRIKNKYLQDDGLRTTFYCSMDRTIKGSNYFGDKYKNIVEHIQQNQADAHGMACIQISLIRVFNPNMKSYWNLRFKIKSLEKVTLSKVSQ